MEAAAPYQTRTEFRTGNHAAHKAAYKLGILDEIFADRPKRGRIVSKWSAESARESALRCTSRTEFRVDHGGAYAWARRHGQLDEFCSHMPTKGNLVHRKVYEIIDATRVYLGLSHDPESRFAEHRLRGTPEVQNLISDGGELRILSDFLTVPEAQALERNLISMRRDGELTVLNKQAGGGVGNSVFVWTLEMTAAAASQCATRGEMQNRFPKEYSAANRHDWTDSIFSEHKNRGYSTTRGPAVKWTKEAVAKVSTTCHSRSELKSEQPGAYAAARKNGWLPDLFDD